MIRVKRPTALCPECSQSGGERVLIPFMDYRCTECGWLWRYRPAEFVRNVIRIGPWRKKSMQDRWDEQIELCLAASHFGRGRETRMIGARMMHCPNNPRNGGDGCDDGDGTWRDRRWNR